MQLPSHDCINVLQASTVALSLLHKHWSVLSATHPVVPWLLGRSRHPSLGEPVLQDSEILQQWNVVVLVDTVWVGQSPALGHRHARDSSLHRHFHLLPADCVLKTEWD